MLCTLCSDNKWYTVTNDNLLIARCLILLKRALLFHNSKAFSGFYFFRPQLQENTQVRTRRVEIARQQNIQTLTREIIHSKNDNDKLKILAAEGIRKINADVDRRIRSLLRDVSNDNNKNIYNARKHKIYCTKKIEETISDYFKNKINYGKAVNEIRRINSLSLDNTRHIRFLDNYDIPNRNQVLVGGVPDPLVTITVKWKKQFLENISVDLSAPVSELKVQLFSLTGVAPDKQKLILGGKTLKDDQSIESYGVKQGSVLLMMGNKDDKSTVKANASHASDASDASDAADAVVSDNSQYPNENVLNICKGYAGCVIDVNRSYIDKINKILESNTEQRKFVFGIGSQPKLGLPPDSKNFIESLNLFLEKVIQKLKDKTVLSNLQIFGDIISHLENILIITIPIIFQLNDDIIFPFCIDYDKVFHVCLLLDMNADEFSIEDFKSKFEKFKSLFPDDTQHILPIADIPTIVRNLVTSIEKIIKLNNIVLGEVLPNIYGLLKGENLETILSNNKDNINNLYFNEIPEVLRIIHSYSVFTESEEVEYYIIQAILGSNEDEIFTKSVYSLYQNISGLYGIYVYDTEILKTFIENIKLQNNMIQYDGGFNSLQTIIDYRCDIEFETMIKDTTTYVSLNQFMQQQEQKIKELEQIEQQEQIRQPLDPMGLREVNQTNQFKGELSVTNGGNNKHNAKYRKKYKKFVSKYIIKKNKKQNKNKNKNKSTHSTKNKTKKNKRLTKPKHGSKSNSKYAKKTLKNKKRKSKSKSKSSNRKSKHNKKAKTNYYNLYKHNKTLKH